MADAHPGLGGIRFGLGGNAFGWTIDRDASFAVLDAFYEAGGRSIDSADGYSSWVPGNTGGESEAIIGAWLTSRGVRKDMRIATKTGQGGAPGKLAPGAVAAAVEASLNRLQTDYIDLYYVHRDQPALPMGEILSTFNTVHAAGKARELAISNVSTERLAAAFDCAEQLKLVPFTVLQPGYNLVWRGEFPADLQQLAVDRGMAVLPYYGLGSGFLTGKYRSEADFSGGQRHGTAAMFAKKGWPALPVLSEIAAETGATMSQVALAWLAARPAIWGPLASASTPAQVRELCGFVSLTLSDDQLSRLTAVSVDAQSPPSPGNT